MRCPLPELLLAGALFSGGLVAARGESDVDAALRDLKTRAWRNHPEVRAAEHRRRAAVARRRGVDAFFEPAATAAAGYAERSPTLPALSRGFGWIGDAFWMEGGIEAAFLPGLHAGVGVAERYRTGGSGGEGGETLAGGQLRVPLRRDRGFRLWQADRDAADEFRNEVAAGLLSALQDIARDVELRYIELQLALAQRDVARAASGRADQLLANAEEMTRLGVIPAHQLNPARLEAARRREEETAAARTVETARRRLVEAIGEDDLPGIGDRPADLLAWARVAEPAALIPSPLAEDRGDYLAAAAALRGEEHRIRRAEEERRSDLTLHAALAWQTGSEDADGGEEGARWAVGLTWRAPIGDTGGRARVDESRARRDERVETLRGVERQAAAEWDIATADHDAAVRRLVLIEEAVETARAALTAETERFQLGEGSSRPVLDAQKDLTDTIRRRNDIAAELLRARARLAHAAGRNTDFGPATAAPRSTTQDPLP